MARKAATLTKDELLDAAERGDAAAVETLVAQTAQEQIDQAAREQIHHEIHERKVARRRRDEQAAHDAETRANRERAIAVRGEGRALAGEIEVVIVRDLCQKISALLKLTKESYQLTGSRAALAAPERLGEYLLVQLGLPSPWAVAKDRKRLSLGQALGLEPSAPPEPATPAQRPVRTAVLDPAEDD